LESDNDEAIKSLLKALAKYPSKAAQKHFSEELINLLENPERVAKANMADLIFAVFSGMDNEILAKALLKHLNQPEKSEAIRQNLAKGLAYSPSRQASPS